MEFLAKVYVTLKSTVNDPQGLTVLGSLRSLGFQSLERVRSGKYWELKIHDEDQQKAEVSVGEMCRQLLANPVIEEFTFEVEPI